MTMQERHFRNVEDFYAENLLVMRGKLADYAEEGDSFSNFRFAALSAGVTIEQVFMVLLGIKLARLKNLLLNGAEPENESVIDTLGDAANYNAILSSYLDMKNCTDPEYAYAAEPGDEDDLATEEDLEELVASEPEIIEPPAPVEPPTLTPAEKLKAFFRQKQ